MMESIEDITINAALFKFPMLVFFAGRDKILRNEVSKEWIKKCGTPKDDIEVHEYENSFHNIHKEPEYKAQHLATIYEFIYKRLRSNIRKPRIFDP